jgi:hypothetical protein
VASLLDFVMGGQNAGGMGHNLSGMAEQALQGVGNIGTMFGGDREP